jgi:hypothetical protein
MSAEEFDGVPSAVQAAAMIDSAMQDDPAHDADADGVESRSDAPSEPVRQESPSIEVHAPYVPPVREDAPEAIASIDAALKENFRQHSDGEIDDDEYWEKQQTLMSEREQIHVDLKIADYSAKAAEYAQRQAWTAAQNRFFEKNDSWRQDQMRYQALDSAVRAVWAEEASQGKSHDWILDEARKRIESAFGIQSERPQKASRQSVPASLTDMPGAPAAGASEFEVVSNLDSLSQLDAVMSWSEDKRNEWLNRRL